MKLIHIIFSGVIAATITSCVSVPIEKKFSPGKTPFKVRFQNSLGLNFYYAGCSTRNWGGVERMCQYSDQNPADLTFQIGPAFSHLLNEASSLEEVKSKQRVLWKIFEAEKVELYSVDPLDFSQSLEVFEESHRDSSVVLISSNLKRGDNYIFKPYLIYEVAGKKIGIISLSGEAPPTKSESWSVEKPEQAFKKVSSELENKVDLFFVLGRVPSASRKQLAELSLKPILFLGGALMEDNTTRVISEEHQSGLAKSPDFGNGFGELLVGIGKQSFNGASGQIELGGLEFLFSSKLLKPVPVKYNACSRLLDSAQPSPFPVEAKN